MIFTLTGGTPTAGAQKPPKQPPAVHSDASPAPVDATPAPASADEHSEHATKTTPKAPADEHSRGLVLGGFAALNASILLAAAGVRRRDPKRQRQARANADG